jgi:hypothetical protein
MKSNKQLYRVFLAALPVIGQSVFENVLWSVCLTTGLFLASSAFFKMTFPLFPKKFFRFAVILFPATAFQAVYYAAGLSPLWAASLFLLYDFKELESGAKGSGRIALRSLYYMAFLFAVGAAHEFLGRQLNLGLFRHPAGFLFLFAAVWILLKAKTPPAKKAEGAL